jgi:putative ATP-dependent endonuclease of OLD family
MAKIHTLSIKHFRGISDFKQVFFPSRFVCLIGRGDSGKSTILEAISIVLSPSWNVQFQDTDFHNCDIETPIEIEVSLYDVPKKLLLEDKFGLYVRGLDGKTKEIVDEVDDHSEILTIKLIVEKDLEPKWYIVNGRQEPHEIRATDRAKLNVFFISDYLDRHFNWNQGGPLYSLLQAGTNKSKKTNVLVDALRAAKDKIDQEPFEHLSEITTKIIQSASKLGVQIDKTASTIDFKDIFIKDGKISLHEDKVPFRLKGKGSKRLLSIAIQLALLEESGVILIDEIEQGLEPDRARHLVHTLKNNQFNQFFVTTHSQNVLVELEATDLFLMKEKSNKLVNFDSSLQGLLRIGPEGFFSNSIIVCEGPTEIGILRSFESYRLSTGKKNLSELGIGYVDGRGSNAAAYCEGFIKSEFKVSLFVDSDVKVQDKEKESLKKLGVEIVDWPKGESVETAILKDLPDSLLKEAVNLAIILKTQFDGLDATTAEQSVKGSIIAQGVTLQENYLDNISGDVRTAICSASRKNEWFKRFGKGESLGNLLFKNYESLDAQSSTKKTFDKLSAWIDG